MEPITIATTLIIALVVKPCEVLLKHAFLPILKKIIWFVFFKYRWSIQRELIKKSYDGFIIDCENQDSIGEQYKYIWDYFTGK